MSVDFSTLADALFPHVEHDISYRKEHFSPRENKQTTCRFAPSPTGFLHIGGVYTSLVAEQFAHQHDGVFILRIEDTDTARSSEEAIDLFLEHFRTMGIQIDEWPIEENKQDKGEYGPYQQSKRKHIYHSFIKHLVAQGKAYPCWMSSEEIDEIRTTQKALKKQPWIYGNYSMRRDKTPEEYMTQYRQDPDNFVIRFKSPGTMGNKIIFDDINRGTISMTENINDMVIMKSGDKLPTYHLAHIVDDHLMRTTHVIRGEEWLTSVPLHLQLFEAFDLTPPTYVHLPSILKNDNGKKRKLSKRKDPESDIQFFFDRGYPVQAIIHYIFTLVDSGYEERFKENPTESNRAYTIDLKKMNNSGALVDTDKLDHISNTYLSAISTSALYDQTLNRAEIHNTTLAKLMKEYPDYTQNALDIERHTDQDPKRFTTFYDVEKQLLFFYDSYFQDIIVWEKPAFPLTVTQDVWKSFVAEYAQELDMSLDKKAWFAQLKEVAKKFGFAGNNKEFREGNYVGKIGDIAMCMRIQLAGATRTPDLYSMIQVMGRERVVKRLKGE